ncbi:VWA domain-containing protein [Bdellovibrio bacteriovorus]
MKKGILLAYASTLVLFFQNCAPNNPTFVEVPLEAAGTEDLASEGSDEATDSPETSQTFKVTYSSEAAPLDMVWVVDNSLSMNEEAAIIRENLKSFISALNKSTNFKFLLISKKGINGTKVALDSTLPSSSFIQLDQEVNSYNGPSILVGTAAQSVTEKFFRENSRKVIVFVTDDDASATPQYFLDKLTAIKNVKLQDVDVSSFITLSKTKSPCGDRAGTAYINLANATGGHNYNICDTKWDNSFADLIERSVAKAVRRFTLDAAGVKEIVDVRVDGVVLAKSSYSFDGKALTLAESVGLVENSSVEINYSF